jgi:hypothetical protein
MTTFYLDTPGTGNLKFNKTSLIFVPAEQSPDAGEFGWVTKW